MTIDSSRVLVDTNVLLRQHEPLNAMHQTANIALQTLTNKGVILCLSPQSLYEFWVVATRPVTARGGFGWSPSQTETELRRLEQTYTLLFTLESAIYREWRRLVSIYSVSGVVAHDARLVAVMKLHGIEEILTFNTKDFARYESENVRVLDPSQVVATTS